MSDDIGRISNSEAFEMLSGGCCRGGEDCLENKRCLHRACIFHSDKGVIVMIPIRTGAKAGGQVSSGLVPSLPEAIVAALDLREQVESEGAQ